MVFVRVHVLKNYLSDEQKKELGDKLIAAVAEVENLHNSERHQQTSWVQYFELERENWYGPSDIGDPDAFWQVDVIAPEPLMPTKEHTRLAIDRVTKAIRSITGDGLLPGRGPWVQVYAIPADAWGMDGNIINWDATRPYFFIESPEEAARVLPTIFRPAVDPVGA